MSKTPKKILGIFVFILFLALSASAVTVSAPAQLPSNVNWSFSAALDSADSFDKATVILDSKELLSAYPNGQVVKDPFNGQFALTAFVVDSEPSGAGGLTLYVSIIGLEPGAHEIKVDTIQGGAVKSSEVSSVNFFVPLSEHQFQVTVESLTQVTDSLKEKTSSFESVSSQFDGFNSRFDELSGKISGLESSLGASGENFSSLEQKVNALQSQSDEKFSSQEGELSKLNAKVFPPEPAGFSLPGLGNLSTGLASFGRSRWLPIFLVLIVAGIAAVFLLRRRSGKGFGSGKGNYEVDDKLFQEGIPAQEDNGKGKWSA